MGHRCACGAQRKESATDRRNADGVSRYFALNRTAIFLSRRTRVSWLARHRAHRWYGVTDFRGVLRRQFRFSRLGVSPLGLDRPRFLFRLSLALAVDGIFS